MVVKISTALAGLLLGVLTGYFLFFQNTAPVQILSGIAFPKKQVIGFLPYWQTNIAKADYSRYITTLTYFGVALDKDGTILKLINPQQLEPGWNGLVSKRVEPFLNAAKKEHLTLSLLVFSGNVDTIDTAMQTPLQSATNLVKDIEPVMHKYGFSDLNLDIEYTAQASPAARTHFTQFVAAVKKNLLQDQTLTVETMSTDPIKPNLIDIGAVGQIADYIVIMAYDYHSPDSFVTGPIAPISGVTTDSEFDVTTAVTLAEEKVPSAKIILGIPLYGYEWESLEPFPRAATINGSGVIASNHRTEALLAGCATCSARLDTNSQELHLSYLDTNTKTYHQFFIPTAASTKAKLALANKENLGGVALWAMGYEGNTILAPLSSYK